MHAFITTVDDILKSLGSSDEMIPEDPLTEFKEFVVQYVQQHDELESNHQLIGQIQNLSSVDDIEQILRQSLDYCDDCVLNLLRKYASGGIEDPEGACPCGDE